MAKANPLRIALIADIHHGIDQGMKLGSAALDLMQPFVDWVNTIRPDLVVELGDRINDLDKDADRKWTRDVAHAFTAVQRVAYLLGAGNISTLLPSRLDGLHQPVISPRQGFSTFHRI